MKMTADLKWHGESVHGKGRNGSLRGLKLAGEHILGVARQQVPHEEGTLERSGVSKVDATAKVPEVAVFFDTPYAVRQHEELDWQHDEGRKAKYLEDPLNDERDTALQLVAAEIRRATSS